LSVNIVLLVRDRPRLTEQCLRTLYQHTDPREFSLVICDDGSKAETGHLITSYGRKYTNIEIVHFARPVGIVGFLRNVGIWTSERVFGPGDWLCFLDNDTAVHKYWLSQFIDCATICSKDGVTGKGVKIYGGCRHPYHGINQSLAMGNGRTLHVTDAVAGYSMFMSWDTWDKYGPFDAHSKGLGQSEDHALSRRVVNDGALVGYIDFPILAHTGITNSDGKPATGAEAFEREPGILYE